MSATPTSLFVLPPRLKQAAPSLSIPGIIQDLRSTGVSKDTKLADAFEVVQQYADSSNQILSGLLTLVSSATVPVTPATTTSGIIAYE